MPFSESFPGDVSETETPDTSTVQPVEDTNTPSGEIPEGSNQRTVSDFYKGIAEQAREIPETSSSIMQESANKASIEEQKGQVQENIQQTQQGIKGTGIFDFSQRRELKQEQKQASQELSELQRDHVESAQTLQELRSPADELNSNIASDQEVARTLNPVRLEELAKANEPIQGQEASVRVADLTREQIAQRKQQVLEQREARQRGEGYTMPLPEDNRTEEQKEEDFEAQAEEYRELALNKLVQRLGSTIQSRNESLRSQPEDPENPVVPLEVNAEALRIFSELAYDEVTQEVDVTSSDIERGYWDLANEASGIESKHYLTEEERNTADHIKERAKNVEQIEKKVQMLMISWQMANEVAQAAGIEEISPQDFLYKVQLIEDKWLPEEERYNHYMKRANRYRQILDSYGQGQTVTRTVLGHIRHFDAYGSYPEGITNDIASFCGKAPDRIDRQDIPTVMAYFAVALDKGIRPVDYTNLAAGIQLALQHTLRNIPQEGSDTNGIIELVEKIRPTKTYGRNRSVANIGDITRPYSVHMFNARAFDIQDNFYKDQPRLTEYV
jgi:hypothetical protein